MNGVTVSTLYQRVIFILLCSTLFCSALRAQDTLNTIIVSQTVKENAARNAKYSPGTRVEKFTHISQITGNNSLSDLLQKQTALYIKEYGRGMSSYLSLRGTSSSHTSIDWNGQSLSVPTLGQADLSHIPLYFFDNMSVHTGGSSALYGNGSIGGSIQLKTTPTYREGLNGDITLKGGSFATLFGGGTLRYGKNNWESRTSAYYSYAKNNYMFSNNTKAGNPRERLNNAAYHNWGALQEVFRKFKDQSQLQMSFMYLHFNRQIQPSVSNNEVERAYHSILDKNTKLSVYYTGNRGKWFYNTRASYSYDYEYYEGDVIAANRIFVNADGEYRINRFSIRAGASAEYIKPDVHAYQAGTHEWRGDLFALLLWNPLQDLTVGGGIRGSFVTEMSVPAQPSIDLKYKVINRNKTKKRETTRLASHDLTLRGAISRSAKVPTLNDRYWGGMTADLKPETGATYEMGIDYSVLYKSWEINSYLTGYHSNVKDWIRWLPAGEIWRPKNVPKVGSKGVEAGFGIIKKYVEWKLSLHTRYAYTNVEMKESLIKNDPSIGHQMAYQPKHTLTANLGATWRKITAGLSYHYTGERTSTDLYDIMPGYSLLDINIQYNLVLWGQNWSIGGELKNILNTNYQNIRFYAMPGINFLLALQWKF